MPEGIGSGALANRYGPWMGRVTGQSGAVTALGVRGDGTQALGPSQRRVMDYGTGYRAGLSASPSRVQVGPTSLHGSNGSPWRCTGKRSGAHCQPR